MLVRLQPSAPIDSTGTGWAPGWGYGYNGQSGSLAKSVENYRRAVNPKVWIHSFDLSHYGTSQFPENQKLTGLYAGWSDKVLQLVPAIEAGENALGLIDGVTPATYKREKRQYAETLDG